MSFIEQFFRDLAPSELLTSFTILIATVSGLFAYRQNARLQRKNYADNIRNSCSLVSAKLERNCKLYAHFYDDIQPNIVDADKMHVSGAAASETRDELWRQLVLAKARIDRRVHDEEIEIAYSDLYGYDSSVRSLYLFTLQSALDANQRFYEQFIERSQQTVFDVADDRTSSRLGNSLRYCAATHQQSLNEVLNQLLSSFRNEMLKIIHSSDASIFKRRVKIRNSSPGGADSGEQPDRAKMGQEASLLSGSVRKVDDDLLCVPTSETGVETVFTPKTKQVARSIFENETKDSDQEN